MKKIIAFIFSLMLILSGTSCGYQSNSTSIHNLYKVERTDKSLFNYTITDRKGNVLVSDTTNRQPKITVINDHILSTYIQYGTGITTRETIYYNVDTGDISETYISVLGEYKNNTVYATLDRTTNSHKVITHNLFNKNKNYKEIVLPDVTVAADFVTKCDISENGIATVTYLKGNNHIETNIEFNLN